MTPKFRTDMAREKYERDQLMERTRAARFYCNNASNAANRAALEMSAFLDLFHPTMPEEKKRELIRDMRP
jgi:hypothetical protein